jgi:hypothetical protein
MGKMNKECAAGPSQLNTKYRDVHEMKSGKIAIPRKAFTKKIQRKSPKSVVEYKV